jgi:hypothetical protein
MCGVVTVIAEFGELLMVSFSMVTHIPWTEPVAH